MFANPKTSIPGVLLLASAACMLVAHLLQGSVSQADWGNVVQGLVGLGLIGAADGGK